MDDKKRLGCTLPFPCPCRGQACAGGAVMTPQSPEDAEREAEQIEDPEPFEDDIH